MRLVSCVSIGAVGLAVLSAEAGPVRRPSRPIAGRYIVVFQDDLVQAAGMSAAAHADNHAARYGGRRTHVYEHALRGYAAEMTEAQAQAVASDPEVAFVEQDGVASINATQSGATWGLDRIDQRDRPLSGTYTYNYTGAGVHAYIVDTGIRASHSQFSGRMSNGYTAIADGNGTNDCNGHGTHVAGTVGGSTHGVAKGVTLHAVRVLGCNGSGANSGVVAGIDWVRANHVKPAVANMSLGGGISSATDNAVANATAAGVVFVVAAGNSNADACGSSPARAPSAITVGSTTSGDVRSSFSNWGTCVDIFAPGSSITSAWYTGDTATNTISGTSMASPHVAGVVALNLQQFGNRSVSTVTSSILSASTTGRLTSLGTGSPNRLLYSLFGTTSVTPTPTPTPRPRAGATPTPTATPVSGYVEVSLPGSAVTASTSDTNIPQNTIDNNLTTRWSGAGDGAWIQYDLGATRTVGHVALAVYNGNTRQNIFDLQVSTGSGVWTTVFSGQSSGTTTAEQVFQFTDVPARYVRYVGHGSTAGTWNSLTEVSIFVVP